MEAVGINISYLLIQVLCFAGFLGALVLAVYLAARMAYNKSAKIDDSELVMTFDVADDGIMIPKSVLQGAEQVELRRTRTQLLLRLIDKKTT